jgi:hypothetical protein
VRLYQSYSVIKEHCILLSALACCNWRKQKLACFRLDEAVKNWKVNGQARPSAGGGWSSLTRGNLEDRVSLAEKV